MDDNFSEFFSMAGMALLFVVAISYAFISYNSLSDRLELFTDTNALGNRSKVATEDIDSTYENRKATRAEVIMAVAGIGRLNSSNQRSEYVVTFTASGNTYTCKYDADNSKIVINGEIEYDADTGTSDLIVELKKLIPADASFEVSYTNDTIIYE